MKIQQIRDMEAELAIRKLFLEQAVKEAEQLKKTKETRELTAKERKRGEELLDLCEDHKDWINSHAKIIKNFYRPAMVC